MVITTRSALSSVRQDLLREGDIYSPQRGHVALAVPLFASFILAHYEHARDGAETNLLSLPAMHGNRGRLAATAAATLTRQSGRP
jgi:hypothetical protein